MSNPEWKLSVATGTVALLAGMMSSFVLGFPEPSIGFVMVMLVAIGVFVYFTLHNKPKE